MSHAVFTSYRLRPEAPDDLAFQALLYASTRQDELAAAKFPPEMRESFLAMQFKAQTAHYRQFYPAAEWQIIECDGRPAGRLIIDRAADHFHVMDLALLPEFRGRGMGSDLLKAVTAEAAARALPVRMFATTGERAIRLYRRLGFREKKDDGLHTELEWRAGA